MKPPTQGRSVIVRVNALAQRAEYIWYDGNEGKPEKGMVFNEMRSKTKCIPKPITSMNAADFPSWSFDGSSTGQAEGNNSGTYESSAIHHLIHPPIHPPIHVSPQTHSSPQHCQLPDCILRPCFICPDPIRGGDDVLVMCDVLDPTGKPHVSNTRAMLEAIINDTVKAEKPLFGFEQEYTMLSKGGATPYGWPLGGYPAPQGPFYCGVGNESVYGRELAEAHMDACIKAGLTISGINAEVMPGQWEFQIGPTGALETGDMVMVARWLLHRLGEEFGIISTFHPKPIKGDWNGAGAHTNYSTESMRRDGGMKAIEAAIERLSKCHPEHISQYGSGNEERLTGAHETCDIDTFRFGVADRGSSIRIPLPVQLANKGYLEDRRPSANVDPYVVVRLLIKNTLL